jgi:hypothetical protein
MKTSSMLQILPIISLAFQKTKIIMITPSPIPMVCLGVNELSALLIMTTPQIMAMMTVISNLKL